MRLFYLPEVFFQIQKHINLCKILPLAFYFVFFAKIRFFIREGLRCWQILLSQPRRESLKGNVASSKYSLNGLTKNLVEHFSSKSQRGSSPVISVPLLSFKLFIS
jgi:hypothetical protein